MNLVPKGVQMGVRFLSVKKSVSNTVFLLLCAFITGQYHSENNMSSKSGAAGD